jgi:dephospho-CoA kinase
VPVIGITGGIASGKSTVSRKLSDLLGARLFDADACARNLTDSDPEIRQQLKEKFGSGLFNAKLELDRSNLRAMIFADDALRIALESILHPRIRTIWISEAAESKAAGSWFLVDIPLLFETGAEKEVDAVLTVACSESTQLERLTHGRGLDQTMAKKIMQTQWSGYRKMERADLVIWSDGSLGVLQAQAEHAVQTLKSKYE